MFFFLFVTLICRSNVVQLQSDDFYFVSNLYRLNYLLFVGYLRMNLSTERSNPYKCKLMDTRIMPYRRVNSVALHSPILPKKHHRQYPLIILIITRLGIQVRCHRGIQFLHHESIGNLCRCEMFLQPHLLLFLNNQVAIPFTFMVSYFFYICAIVFFKLVICFFFWQWKPNYSATIDEEFDFQVGDVIAVTATPDDGWWSGELLAESGSSLTAAWEWSSLAYDAYPG